MKDFPTINKSCFSCENAQSFKDHQTKIKFSKLLLFVEKVSFQVKNEKKLL